MTKTIRTLAALALVGASFASNYSSALATTLKRMSVADLSRDSSHSRPRAMHHKLRALGCRRDLDLHHFRRRGNLERIGTCANHSTSARRQRRKFHVNSLRRPAILARRRINSVPRAHSSPGLSRSSAGCRALSESASTAPPAKKPSRKTPPPSPSSIRPRSALKRPASAKCQSVHSTRWS